MRFGDFRVARLAKKITPRITATKQLSQRLQNSIQCSGLIRGGDRVGVAVSGGADSVALLLLLVAGKKISVLLSACCISIINFAGARPMATKNLSPLWHIDLNCLFTPRQPP